MGSSCKSQHGSIFPAPASIDLISGAKLTENSISSQIQKQCLFFKFCKNFEEEV